MKFPIYEVVIFSSMIIFVIIVIIIFNYMDRSDSNPELITCKEQCTLNNLTFNEVKVGAYGSFNGCYCNDNKLIKRIY